jgi:biotin operon repressor
VTQKHEILTILKALKPSKAQLADYLMTSPGTVSVNISELRRDGHTIRSERAEGTNGTRYRLEEENNG